MSDADRRSVAIAGHSGDATTASGALHHPDPAVRATALAALDRLEELDDATLVGAFVDPSPVVRRRAATIAARRPALDLAPLLADDNATVVEVAAWACGEHERVPEPTFATLLSLAGDAVEPLVRESTVAALGAIGDRRALPVILRATSDKPAIRRRAVLALAPFLDDPDGRPDQDVAKAIDRALADRDWQVRQAAEDLRG